MRSLLLVYCVAPLVLGGTLYRDNIDLLSQIRQLQELTSSQKKINLTSASPSPRVAESDVSFRVYNRKDEEGKAVSCNEANKIKSITQFNERLSTVFIIHGWMNNCNSSSVTTQIRESLLTNHDVNIITVCWDSLANWDYINSCLSVEGVGRYVGDFIRTLSETNNYPLENIKVVGHSLGAHIAGYAGKENGGDLAYIIGLDPAGPLYFENDKDNRLDESDAKYVQVIHTDAGLLGANYKVGHLDFWPNGGENQPGCWIDFICSHGRSYVYYAESIVNNNFIARRCTSYDDYINGKCEQNEKTRMGGYILDDSITGNYYLETADSSPYAEGDKELLLL